jgi:hypothetical protein
MKKHIYKSPALEALALAAEGIIADSSSQALEIPDMVEEKLEWE